MGKRGPPPTPTDILSVRGSWRAKIREGEPTPLPGLPEAPEWLADEARAEWDRQTSLLYDEGRLMLIDRGALAMYCAAWGEFVEAYLYVKEHGSVSVTEKGNEIQHPMVGVRNKSREAAIRIGNLFGFTPSSRVGLKTPPKPEADTSKKRFFAS